MRQLRPAFHVWSVPVYLPSGAAIGLAVISWLALPTAQQALGRTDTGVDVVLYAALHGIAVYFAIFVHELGHLIAARRYGYRVQGIVVHLVGGHTAITGPYTRSRHQFVVAVGGPFATGLIAAAAYGIAAVVPSTPFDSLIGWLAWTSTALALVNLLPGTPLDGGAALSAIVWRLTRTAARGRIIAAYGGFLVAGLWAASPWILSYWLGYSISFIDIALSFMVAGWLFSASLAELGNARRGIGNGFAGDVSTAAVEQGVAPTAFVDRTPAISSITRRSIGVEAEVSCEAAVERSVAESAGALVIMRDGKPVGIVSDAALASVPESERPRVSIASVSRRITESDFLDSQRTLAQVAEILNQPFASEWLVMDADRRIVGVLQRADLQKALLGVDY